VAGDANDDVYWFFLSIVISPAKPFVLIRCCHSIDQYFQSILNSFILFFFGDQVARCLPELIKLHASHLGSGKTEKRNKRDK